jgi:ABC-2 type transport system permease protein
MIRAIARHEWRLLRAERAVWLACGLLAVCAAYAAANGIGWRERRAADVAGIVAAGEAELGAARAAAAGGGDGSAGAVGSARLDATLPAGPLADFTVGQSDLHPHRAYLSLFRRPDDLFGWYQLASPLSLLSGRFDLAFVVVYLLPLVVIGLGYDLLSRERESGTLTLVLAQPVTLRALAAGKVAARLAVGATLWGALGLAAYLLAGDFGGERPFRFLLWLLVAAAYGLFWLALAVAAAAAGWRSETAAAALATAWLVLVLVVPGLIGVAVEATHPAPSRLEVVTAMRRAANEAARESAALLARYYHEHPELAPAADREGFLPRYYAAQREVARRVTPVVAAFERRLEEQQALVRRLRFLSPALVAQEAFADLAGTGADRQRRFAAQARSHLDRWHELLGPKVFAAATLAPAEYDALPRFTFAEEPLATVAARAAGGMAGLLAPAFALALWGWRRLPRFPIVDR